MSPVSMSVSLFTQRCNEIIATRKMHQFQPQIEYLKLILGFLHVSVGMHGCVHLIEPSVMLLQNNLCGFFLFLKTYLTVENQRTTCKVDEKAMTKWLWNFVHLLSAMRSVIFPISISIHLLYSQTLDRSDIMIV